MGTDADRQSLAGLSGNKRKDDERCGIELKQSRLPSCWFRGEVRALVHRHFTHRRSKRIIPPVCVSLLLSQHKKQRRLNAWFGPIRK
mmetsp:Transcript_6472/g.14712  ORF Transcript_6472/g.14712 Transcript_6472/m.14712 type:complete len:87 (-) Transcript_6472:431-691(-)